MKATLLVCIILASGAMAGLVHGAVNLVLVEPYIDVAAEAEARGLIGLGLEQDTPEFWAQHGEYRAWQKGGQVLAGAILGMSMGALFGIVFALCRGSLPGGHDARRALLLAGVMCAVLYVVPSLKYPASLPASGDPETVALRGALYLAFVAISGLGALGFYALAKKMGWRMPAALAGYAALMAAAFLAMPGNPDQLEEPTAALQAFRAMSAAGVASFWASAGLFLGLLWDRFMVVRRDRGPA